MGEGAGLQRLAGWLEAPIRVIGVLCGWLVLACVLLTFAVVVLRYGFSRSGVAAQELVLHLNAAVFLLGGAWALLHDRHVRVDIAFQGWPPRTQARVELAGIVLLLLPFCVFWLWISLDYVAASWRVAEGSREVGGLPGVYLVKTLIPVAAGLLVLAGVARALRMLSQASGGPMAGASAPATGPFMANGTLPPVRAAVAAPDVDRDSRPDAAPGAGVDPSTDARDR